MSVVDTLLAGNGTQGPFTGVLTNPQPVTPFILQGSVNFNCLDGNENSMVLVDYPVSNTTGVLGLQAVPQTSPSPLWINKLPKTGYFVINFPANTKGIVPIIFEGIFYQPGRPTSMLYFDNEFTIRPVPDKTYPIQIEVDAQPTEIIVTSQSPELKQWWSYIAYLTARIIFGDQGLVDNIQQIMPELNRQERLVLRRTLEQQVNERTQTIYSNKSLFGNGWWPFGGSWPY